MRFYASLIPFLTLVTSFTAVGQSTQKTWWKESVFYEIYMPSYADSNGDGYGDFKGMEAKLDHLQKLGVKGIWLTPFLLSPKVDNGYDVASYYDIDPVYGNTDDFKNYVAEAHKRGIKVIMDMVLNHTSTESKWFKEASKGKDNPYRDYYIWRDKPNNWESFFGGPAWQKDPLSGQYYYHKFDVKMADLNWSNPQVVKEVQEALRYWLNLGVDGFRLDVINFLTTESILTDNPVKEGKQEHQYDIDQAGVKDAIQKIRAVVDEYKDRFIVGEIGSDKIDILKQYQSPGLLDVVFNFNFGSIPSFSTKRIYDELQSMENNMPGYPTLFFGSHDMPRIMDRLAGNDPEKALALAALMLTAKGIPFIYYGEEIGMRNTIAKTPEEMRDIQGKTFYKLAIDAGKNPAAALVEGNDHNRDKSRSPMQWDSSPFAGFSTRQSWIPVNSDFDSVNVERLQQAPYSILNGYKQLIALRNSEKALQYGRYKNLQLSNDLLSFERIYKKEKITVVINFGKGMRKIQPGKKLRILYGTDVLVENGVAIYK
ncbi:alpha-glucosidase [Ferruginibacter sp. HRS2-29]|uniref:glycoside hydrolase family 13 protein n=1 Tax=Ferruginibacter sp. HRS2-29 TaxID=2487334 RepID=UPI0020CE6E6D|nr:alpha-glucosidase [Ferruginibacter sp. HRS2-29]MCP9750425.1 alpha-glucosidase [Ferruginibacter sp. HRS2-29]